MDEATKQLLWHVAIITFKENITPETKQIIYNLYQTLAEDCGGEEAGILFWRVGNNLDQRKGAGLVEVSIFEDADALQRFRGHPKHTELTNILREVADWKVGDIHFLFPTPPSS